LNVVERLWRPTEKDVVGGLRQQRFTYLPTSQSVAAAQITFLGPNTPPDTARFITHIAITCTPGAAQFFQYWQGQFIGAGGGSFTYFTGGYAPVAGAVVPFVLAYDYDGLLLLPGEAINFVIQFNAGVAANSCGVTAMGFDLPRANLV
jgi:hypothetical protein